MWRDYSIVNASEPAWQNKVGKDAALFAALQTELVGTSPEGGAVLAGISLYFYPLLDTTNKTYIGLLFPIIPRYFLLFLSAPLCSAPRFQTERSCYIMHDSESMERIGGLNNPSAESWQTIYTPLMCVDQLLYPLTLLLPEDKPLDLSSCQSVKPGNDTLSSSSCSFHMKCF